MTLTQLEVFVAIVETQSFTKAGEKLGLSQSAISHALKHLEQEWGVKLLERSRGAIMLLPIGVRLLHYAKEMLRLNQSIREEVAKEKGLVVGTVRIASFPTASAAWLPDVFASFHELYPAIDTVLLEGGHQDIQGWLQNGSVDLGILPLPQEEFDAIELLSETYVVVVPVGHPLEQRQVCRAEDLQGVDFIIPLDRAENLISEWMKKHQVEPRIHLALDYTSTIMAMVRRGLGISIAPSSSFIPSGVVSLPLEPELKRTIGLAARSLQNLSPAVKAMISIFQTVFATRPGGNGLKAGDHRKYN